MTKDRSVRSTLDKSPRIFRSAYSGHVAVVTMIDAESVTKQSFKDEADINVIMRRYEKTGVMPFLDEREPRFMDCTGFDYQEAQLLVTGARSMFEELPAALRARFDNDPARLLEFLNDERNREEAITLGLVKPKPPEEAPVQVEVMNAPDRVVEVPEGLRKPPKKGAD